MRDEVLVALGEACEAVAHLLESWPSDEDPGPGIRLDLARWRGIVQGFEPPATERGAGGMEGQG